MFRCLIAAFSLSLLVLMISVPDALAAPKITSYIRANSQLVAKIDESNKVDYYHNDFVLNVRAVTNGTKDIVEYTDYYPFGKYVISPKFTGSLENEPKYKGEVLDKATDYYRMGGSSFYDYRTGRFLIASKADGDLLLPDSLNKYSYMMNNPFRETRIKLYKGQDASQTMEAPSPVRSSPEVKIPPMVQAPEQTKAPKPYSRAFKIEENDIIPKAPTDITPPVTPAALDKCEECVITPGAAPHEVVPAIVVKVSEGSTWWEFYVQSRGINSMRDLLRTHIKLGQEGRITIIDKYGNSRIFDPSKETFIPTKGIDNKKYTDIGRSGGIKAGDIVKLETFENGMMVEVEFYNVVQSTVLGEPTGDAYTSPTLAGMGGPDTE
jgi:RHS repeat-associated protein